MWASKRAAVPITKAQPREPLQFCWRAGALGSGYARGGTRTCKVPVPALRRGVPSLPALGLLGRSRSTDPGAVVLTRSESPYGYLGIQFDK